MIMKEMNDTMDELIPLIGYDAFVIDERLDEGVSLLEMWKMVVVVANEEVEI